MATGKPTFQNAQEPREWPLRQVMPLLVVRDVNTLPGRSSRIVIEGERAVTAIEEAIAGDKYLFLASARRRTLLDPPESADILSTGRIGRLHGFSRHTSAEGDLLNSADVLVEGTKRARISRLIDRSRFYLVETEEIPEAAISWLAAKLYLTFRHVGKMSRGGVGSC